MKYSKSKVILILSTVLLLVFTSLSFIAINLRLKMTVEESIVNHNLEVAKGLVNDLDIETYKKFLISREQNEQYWKIREQLNEFREQLGALYVYTLDIDNPEVSKSLIVGMPRSYDNFKIGEQCTVPKKYVERAFFYNEPYVTEEIQDPKYGTYMSVGVPIKEKSGNVIGYLGMDISSSAIHDIEESVIKDNVVIFIFIGLFIIMIIVSFLLLQRWYQKEVAKEVGHAENTYQSELRTLIASVSSFRHDYINHIQVIQGLLQIGAQEKALEYVTSLNKEVQMINKLKLTIEHPGLAILLQTKKLAAENYQIIMDLDITQNTYSYIKSIDLIKILSNLIDNAIDATMELPESNRKIEVNCIATDTKYIFQVTNPSSKKVETDLIFKQGYTTKNSNDSKVRGQGLFIVKEIVNKYKGIISLVSTNDQKVIARVEIPIKLK
ncbi:sensor kinase SpoOB-type protein [Ureibacillus xyleni]|uniref:Sensor kinase SpoOB-type protein n=1 Tax=Ureibacillus xyleni TaxID=614648 RepID=A0A285SXL7_9BACL|nr:GHKL domain-containing protein [Ureibacillus xyleni]SOC11280.1 sensor kinase SpoOB-type protein [Ureibacillus xyleni]